MLYQIILKNFKSSWKNYFVYFTGNIIGVAEFFVFLGLYSVSKVIMKDASADLERYWMLCLHVFWSAFSVWRL